MTNFVRATAFVSAEVDVPADAFWKVLRDWPGVMKWAIGEDPPAPIIGTTLKPGHHVDVLPCTRVCSYDTTDGFQPFLEETLLHADPEARRIYYNIEGVMENGMRNYHATTFIDEIEPNRARVTCSSSYDVPDETTADAMRAFLETVYRRWVIAGIATVAQQDLAAVISSDSAVVAGK